MKKLIFLLLPALGWSQALRLDGLDKLSAKAASSVNVTLDGSLLRLASKFIDDDEEESAQIKKLVASLNGIYVRTFEFKNAGEYLDSDLDAIRAQLKDPKWKKIVEVRSKTDGESDDVYLRQNGEKITGLAVIAAEPKELTIVNIDGPLDPDGLKAIAGNFGIPSSIGKKLEKKAK